MRNQADYNQLNNNMDKMIKKSKIRSERIVKLLNIVNYQTFVINASSHLS